MGFGVIVLGVLFVGAGLMALSDWLIMLVLGAVHAEVFAAVPALGFWQTVLTMLLVGLVGGVFTGPLAARFGK